MNGVPRSTDPAERRRHLLDAVSRITSEPGLEDVSIREVAAAAGISPAQVQYYFRTKAEMLRLAYEHVCEKLAERVAKVDLSTGTVGQVLRRGIHAWLPLDDDPTAEARVWTTFAARAVVESEFARIETAITRDTRDRHARGIREAHASGEATADLDRKAARITVAILDAHLAQFFNNRGETSVPAPLADATLSRSTPN